MAEKNDNRPVAIQVSGVKKMYRLGQIGGGTLQSDLQSWWARVKKILILRLERISAVTAKPLWHLTALT